MPRLPIHDNYQTRLAWALAAAAVLLALELWLHLTPPVPARAVWPLSGVSTTEVHPQVLARGLIPMPADTPAAHASQLLALPAGHSATLLAFWFAGTRESGPDVRIAASAFDRVSQRWLPPRWVADRQLLGAQLGFGLRRLGNPVAWLDGQGRIHLFVVATGLGGWAAGRILHLRQVGNSPDFEHLAFAPVRVLPLSWLWNTSYLVRTAPLPLADGGMVLPVHFELGRKYPVALRFDVRGEFLGMTPMSHRTHLLQPALLARAESDWLALLRDGGPQRKLRAVQTDDGGRQWRDLPDPGLPNPDAAVAALALRPGQFVMAHNPRAEGRSALDLSTSADGLHWTRLLTLAEGEAGAEYSYPALAYADGSLWISYTDQRRAIAWQRLALTVEGR